MNRQQKRAYAKKINTPQKLEGFYKNVDYKLRQEYDKIYEDKFNYEMEKSMDTFILSIVFTLHFNEQTKFGGKRIHSFMQDLLATVENFNDGSYNPTEYIEMLKKDGIEYIPSEYSKKGDK